MPRLEKGQKFFTESGKAKIVGFELEIVAIQDGEPETEEFVVWTHNVDSEVFSSVDIKKDSYKDFISDILVDSR